MLPHFSSPNFLIAAMFVVGCWRGYLFGQGADLHMVQRMPLLD